MLNSFDLLTFVVKHVMFRRKKKSEITDLGRES